MNTIEVLFPRRYDPAAWNQEFEGGRKPDAWPYGLNHFFATDSAIRVTPILVDPASGTELIRSLVSPARSKAADDAMLAWDEWTAISALSRRRHRKVFAGVIWATDRSDSVRERMKKAAVLSALRRADGLWCLTRPQVDALRLRMGSEGPPVSFLCFGIDENFFSYSPYPDRPLVVSVGGDRDRDAATLFTALDLIKRTRPGVQIIVQNSSGITPPDGVEVIRRLSHLELRDLYRRASVVVVATRSNLHGSGMTVSLEAQATGRPVVITRTQGIEDYVDDGRSGSLAEVGNAADIASQTLKFIDDKQLATEAGIRGREKVEASHTSTQMARALEKIVSTRER